MCFFVKYLVNPKKNTNFAVRFVRYAYFLRCVHLFNNLFYTIITYVKSLRNSFHFDSRFV